MNKTLLNVKNLLKIIISCLVIMSMLKSCSMAYNIDDVYDYALQIGSMENVPTYVLRTVNRFMQMYNRLKNYQELQNCKSMLLYYDGDNLTVYYYNEAYKISFNTGNLYGLPATNVYYVSPADNIRHYTNRNYLQKPGYQFGLLDLSLNTQDEINNFNWGDWYLNNKYDEPSHFIYTPYNITTIDDYNILKFTYTGNIGIGLLGENDFYQLQVRLKDSSLTTLGTLFFNENQHCYSQDNALLVENDTRILANTVYLSYYEPYYLEFTIYSDSTNYEIQGFLYKFYPPNSVIENGQIVSPGSGDYTNQNQTIDIIGGVVGELPSGDSPGSGILGGIASLFIPSSDFFLTYFNNLNNWLTDHLGFLYAPFSIVFDLLNRIILVDFSDPMVEFGPFTLPLNDDIPLVGHYEYHFNDLLDDSNLAQIHDIYLVIIDGILILGFLYMLYCKYEEIIGGKKE